MIFRMPRGQEKFVAIADLQGFGYSNSDTRGFLAALSILQVCSALSFTIFFFFLLNKEIGPFLDQCVSSLYSVILILSDVLELTFSFMINKMSLIVDLLYV